MATSAVEDLTEEIKQQKAAGHAVSSSLIECPHDGCDEPAIFVSKYQIPACGVLAEDYHEVSDGVAVHVDEEV